MSSYSMASRSAMWLALAASVVVNRAAGADNKGGGEWTCANHSPPCIAETSVPDGCPIHVVVPHGGLPTGTLMLHATRGRGPSAGRKLEIRGASVLANTFSQIGHYMNFYANCDLVETTTELDRLVVSMPGVHAGDIVEEWGQSVAGTSALAYSVFRPGVTITARGPCPAEQWPTLEYSMGSCDKMPVLPPQPVPPVPRAPADRPESSRDISLFVILAIGGLVSLAAAVLLYLRHHKRDI